MRGVSRRLRSTLTVKEARRNAYFRWKVTRDGRKSDRRWSEIWERLGLNKARKAKCLESNVWEIPNEKGIYRVLTARAMIPDHLSRLGLDSDPTGWTCTDTQVFFTYHHPCLYVPIVWQTSPKAQDDVTVVRGASYDAAGQAPEGSSGSH